MSNGWIRYPGKLYYVARGAWTSGGLKWAYTRRLGPISYWLIKWIHGDKKLREMAEKVNNPPDVTSQDKNDG